MCGAAGNLPGHTGAVAADHQRIALAGQLPEISPHDRIAEGMPAAKLRQEILHQPGEQRGVAVGPESRNLVVRGGGSHRGTQISRRRVAEIGCAHSSHAAGIGQPDRLPNICRIEWSKPAQNCGDSLRSYAAPWLLLSRRRHRGQRQHDPQIGVGAGDAVAGLHGREDRLAQSLDRCPVECRGDRRAGGHQLGMRKIDKRCLRMDVPRFFSRRLEPTGLRGASAPAPGLGGRGKGGQGGERRGERHCSVWIV